MAMYDTFLRKIVSLFCAILPPGFTKEFCLFILHPGFRNFTQNIPQIYNFMQCPPVVILHFLSNQLISKMNN